MPRLLSIPVAAACTCLLLATLSCAIGIVEGQYPGDCTDGADNDRDGLVDCADPVCIASLPSCTVELCENGVDDNGDGYFRTSETCDLDHADPFVAAINARLDAFAGIATAHGEPIQGQRYSVGQEFKAHTDYFEPDGQDFDKYCSVAGQRTWTVMIYLNEPEAGGATRFRVIDKIVKPETGKLLAWSNLRPDGTPNAATLHHAMKVRAGTKYVVTKWFRERPWG